MLGSTSNLYVLLLGRGLFIIGLQCVHSTYHYHDDDDDDDADDDEEERIGKLP